MRGVRLFQWARGAVLDRVRAFLGGDATGEKLDAVSPFRARGLSREAEEEMANESETESREVAELQRRLRELEEHPDPSRFPGGRRGVDFEIEFVKEQLAKLLRG